MIEAATVPQVQVAALTVYNAAAWWMDLDTVAKLLGVVLAVAYLIGQVIHIRIKSVELRTAKERLERERRGDAHGPAE